MALCYMREVYTHLIKHYHLYSCKATRNDMSQDVIFGTNCMGEQGKTSLHKCYVTQALVVYTQNRDIDKDSG